MHTGVVPDVEQKLTREEILSGIIETETLLNKIQDVDVLMERFLPKHEKLYRLMPGLFMYVTGTGWPFIMPRMIPCKNSFLQDKKLFIRIFPFQ